MGRGDKKTRKGKIFAGSFGKSRPHKVAAKATPKKEKVEVEVKPKKGPAKKAKAAAAE